MSQNYSITFCGSSRVGKSTLINALVGKEVAKTSSSLQPCTTVTQKYTLERYGESTDGPIKYHIELWDTPGIEKWSESDVRSYFSDVIQQTNPICVIYCASPTSVADKDQVTWLVDTCLKKEIFVALVCTNMHAGMQAHQIMEGFEIILDSLELPVERHDGNGIVYYGRMALCTKVNSRQFIHKDFGISAKPSGVEELMFGITKCLDSEKQLIWLRTIAENRRFWESMYGRLTNVLQIPVFTLKKLLGQALGISSNRCEPPIPTATVTVENEVRSSCSSTSRVRPKKETSANIHLRPVANQSTYKTQQTIDRNRAIPELHSTSTKPNYNIPANRCSDV